MRTNSVISLSLYNNTLSETITVVAEAMIVMLLLNSSLFSLRQEGVICFTDLALLTDLFFRSETAVYLLFKEMIKLQFVWTNKQVSLC